MGFFISLQMFSIMLGSRVLKTKTKEVSGMGMRFKKEDLIKELKGIIDKITSPLLADHTIYTCYSPEGIKIHQDTARNYEQEIRRIIYGLAEFEGELPSALYQLESMLNDKDYAVKLWAIGIFLNLKLWTDTLLDPYGSPY